MEDLNIVPIIVAALIPTVMGFLYYNPKTVGKAWMDSLGMNEEDLQKDFNMAVVTIVGLVLSFFMAFGINAVVEMIHTGINDAGELIGTSHHTFGHGAFHGMFIALVFVIPPLVTNGLYQRNSWKNIIINSVYWIITIALMSGLMDAWN